MYSLFCEAKFWTLKNDIQIRNTDFGVCRYYDKKEIDECPYLEGKKSYCDLRGTTFVLKNKRPLKLRDGLKELEQQLSSNKVVFFDWKDDNILHIMLNTGLIIAIGVSAHTKDIYKITFDRFLIGKLLSENICDVISTKTHLVISYNENQLTIINFTKPYTKFNLPQKLTKLEPKVQQVELSGPSGRRLERRLSCNISGDMLITWWHSTRNEVYPWSPLVKDEDRANIHIYSLIGTKIELLCFYRTEFDLIKVCFSQIKPNLVWLIEQKVSKKGDVAIEYSSYEIVKNFFKKISITSIPLQTQICCHSISPDEEKLLLGCIDGSLILFDETRGITRLVKTAFIPNIVSWHNDGALIIIANEKSQFQFFDFALSCIRAQLLSEDVTPSNLLDLASYFKIQPTLLNMKWNKKSHTSSYIERYIPNDNLLLLIFESGPLGVLNLIGGGGLLNDVQNCGLTPDTIIRQYLLWNQTDKALNLLLSLNWNTNGSSCLAGLYHIANYIFKHPFTPEREIQLEAALGSFHAPIRPLTRYTENEFGNQVHDLTRRFFHHLLRHQLYEKAYCLAIDLSNADLFVDLYNCAKLLNDEEMAFACSAKVDELNCISDNSSHSSCSRSSCSCSETNTEDEEDEEDAILPPLPQVSVKKSKASRVPPLPDLNRHSKLRGSTFFNCSSNYLESESINTVQDQRHSKCLVESSNGLRSQTASTSFNEFYPSLLNHGSKTFDCNLTNTVSNTQILTPEFPHSYEIRTSFSGQDNNINTFTPIDPTPQKLPNYKIQKNPNLFPPRPNTLNVIEKLYDIPTNLNLNFPSRQDDFLKKDFTQSRPDLSTNNTGPLKLKHPHIARQNQFYSTSSIPNSQFCTSKIGSFDYLLSSPPDPKLLYNGDRSVRMNQPMSFGSNYQFPKNFPSRPYIPPPKNHNNFNNVMIHRPLFTMPSAPNLYHKQSMKPINPPSAKQKVKFSDTVTQIVVPDISKISLEDETQHKTRSNRNPRTTVSAPPPPLINTTSSQCLGNTNYSRDFNARQDQHDEEENNGTIKVIHFGVV